MGAAPIHRSRRTLAVAVAVVLGLACTCTSLAAPIATTGAGATWADSALPKGGLWALEIDRLGLRGFTLKGLVRARSEGINTLVADPQRLTPKQIARARLWSTQAKLRFLRPALVDGYASTLGGVVRRAAARCAVLHHAKQQCVVMTRRVATAVQLSRRGVADVVVLRLNGPTLVPKNPATRTPILALVGLTATPSFNTTAWTNAIGQSAAQPTLDLGVLPTGTARGTAVNKYLNLLSAKTVAGVPPGLSTPAPDTTPPSTPTGLVATAVGGTSAAMGWTASTDASLAGYRLFQDGVEVGTTASTSFTFAVLPCWSVAGGPGSSVKLGVSAYDGAENASPVETITFATQQCPGDHQAPSRPSGLAAAAVGQTSVALVWNPASDNVGVVGYVVRKFDVDFATAATTSYTATGLSCGTIYKFSVYGVDAAGNAGGSVALYQSTLPCGDIASPSIPGGLAASNVTVSGITLDWAAATDDVGVAGYYLYQDGVQVGAAAATTYAFSGLSCWSTPGAATYTLGVAAYDAAGNVSPVSSITQSTLQCPIGPDTTPPSTPSGLVTSAVNKTSFTLDWNPSTDNVGVVGYQISRDGTALGTVGGTTYAVSGLTCGTTYVIGVSAFDLAGNPSATASLSQSTQPCAAPADGIPPSTPTGLTPSAVGQTSITLGWTASTDNVGVTGYPVSRNGVPLATPTGTSYVFSGLACGTSYTLGVAAVDAAGNVSGTATVSRSTAACPDTTPPSTPTGLATSAVGQTSITLGWTASTDNVGVTGYRTFRNGTQVATPAGTSYVFSGLACGTSYTLGVAAVDAAGNVSGTATVSRSTAACPDTTPPSTPTALATSAVGQTSITLGWTASTDNVGVTGYRTFRNGTQVGTPAGTSYVFSGLTCGTSYTLSTAAVDAAGNVSSTVATTQSTAACADTTPPSTPTALATSAVGQTSITLGWTASTDNVGVTGYRTFRNGTQVATPAGTSYVFSGLACSTSYTLGVAAVDAAGNVSGTATVSQSTAACSDTTPPSTPTVLSTSGVSQSAVTLGWTASTDNVGVTGYRMFQNGTQVGTALTTSYAFSGLACGTSYTLGVAAVDAAGNVSGTATVAQSTSSCGSDTTPPSTPAGLATSAVGQTSITLSWTASTDNVGVTGYALYQDGVQVGTAVGSSYVFTGLSCWVVPGAATYDLSVDAFDAAGNVSGTATISQSTTACSDTTPPSTPTGLATSAVGQTSIALSWTASTDNVGVTGYRMFQNGTQVGTALTTSYAFTALACGTSYTLGVAAVDAAGNVSGIATVAQSTSSCGADTTPPSMPAGLVTSAVGQTSITLSWTASTDNVGVTGYALYQDGVQVGTAVGTSYVFTGLSCWLVPGAATYDLSVDAFDAAGNVSGTATVSQSTAACSDTTPPSTPTVLSTSGVSQSAVTLGWTASTDNVGVTGYRMFQNGTQVGTALTTSYAFTALACGTSYTLGVAAVDAAGNVSGIATVAQSTSSCGADTTPPSTPAGLATSAVGQTSITLGWTASTDNIAVAGYSLSRGGTQVGTTAGTNYTFSGLTCGTSYTLSVDGFDAAGNHSAPASISGVTSACGTTPGTANLWVDTNGGTCTRSSTAVAYVDPAGCGSVNAAYQAASPGDVVLWKGGTYGKQTIGVSASKTNAASDVTVQTAPGEQVTLTADLEILGSHLIISGASSSDRSIKNPHHTLFIDGISNPGSGAGVADTVTGPNRTNHVIVRYYAGANFQIGPGTDITVDNNDWGPSVACNAAYPSGQTENQVTWSGNWPGTVPTNITVSNSLIHDMQTDNAVSCHSGGLIIQSFNGLTISGNKFYRNIIYNTEFDEFTGSQSVTGLLMENNWYGPPVGTNDHTNGTNPAFGDQGQADVQVKWNGHAANNWLVRYNSFSQGFAPEWGGAPPSYTNFRVIANVGGTITSGGWLFCKSFGKAGVTYAYNVMRGFYNGSSPGGNPGCGGSGAVNLGTTNYSGSEYNYSALPFVAGSSQNPNLHLSGAPGSTGADNVVVLGTGDYALASDIDGDARPRDPNRDAGAGER